MCFCFVLQTDQDHNIFKKLSAENIDSKNGWVSTWMWATHYHMWATHTHWWATHRHRRSTHVRGGPSACRGGPWKPPG